MSFKHCLNCEIEFEKPVNCSVKEWAKRKFCSHKCAYDYKNVECKCDYCGKTFKRRKGMIRHKKTYCSQTCSNRTERGGQVIDKCLFCDKEFKHKKSVPTKFCSHLCSTQNNRGKNHFNWKNGLSNLNHLLRNRRDYKDWRDAVYRKDNWTCQVCKKHCGKDIIAHHIKPWADYPELRYDVNNGMVACRSCHKKIHKEIGIKTRFK